MFIPLDDQSPKNEQISRFLSQKILSGELGPGDRLPSTRSLATELGVSRNTVLIAFDRLHQEGYVEGWGPKGTKVATDIPMNVYSRREARSPSVGSESRRLRLSRFGRSAIRHGKVYSPHSNLERPGRIADFRHNVILGDRTSITEWNQIHRRVTRGYESRSREFAPGSSSPQLQEVLARHLRRNRGVDCAPAQVQIVPGPQYAFFLIVRMLLDPGDAIVIEDPHYLGARNNVRALGGRIIPVGVDRSGIRVEKIPESAAKAKAAYVVPSHQWPTGAVLPLARRMKLLQWARKTGAWIIENDHNFEYRYDGPPVESLHGLDPNGPVIYVGTLARLSSPLLQVGYFVSPRELIEPFRAAMTLDGIHPSMAEQETLAEFIDAGGLDRLTRRIRKWAGIRRQSMHEALQRYLGDRVEITRPDSGFHLHVRLKNVEHGQVGELLDRAEKAGLGLYPDLPFYMKRPRRPGLIFGFGDLDPEQIDRGVERAARVVLSLEN